MIVKACLIMFLGLGGGPSQTVNCLVAVVSGQPVTLTDVQIVVEFGLYPGHPAGPDQDPRYTALDALIDRKVVLEVVRASRGIEREELGRALGFLRDDLGQAEFARRLRKFGLLDSDLLPYLEEKLLFERAVVSRFNQNLPVTRTEIERYYRDVYVPELTRSGVPALPLDEVAAMIETRIREQGRSRKVADWIKGLRERSEIQIKADCLK